MMTPTLRRFMFTAHVTTSVGWFGAVLVFVALASIGLASQDEATVRGAYLLMAPAAWFVLVPLAHASLITGVVVSLGTAWGLLRHYWVVLKLMLTAFATVILLVYMGTFRQMAGVAADPVVNVAAVRNASPLVHSVLAVVLLLVTTALGVYKPLGMTPRGARLRREGALSNSAVPAAPSRWTPYVFGVALLLVVILLGFLHSAGVHGQRAI